MDFDNFVEFYKEWNDKPHMFMLNPYRMKQMQAAYQLLEEIEEENNLDFKMQIHTNTFNDGSAYISVVTDDIIVTNIIKFIDVIKDANNFEVYPLVDGRMQMNIMFENLMSLIK